MTAKSTADKSTTEQTLRAHMTVHDAKAAIAFYARAFGATETFRLTEPSGKVGHAEIQIGDSVIMLADEFPDMGHRGPKARGGTTVSLMVYLPDVDAAFKRAIDAGATEKQPVRNQFYGDRSGTLEDPFGHQWTLGTHVEDVPEAEMESRMKDWAEKQKQAEPA